jgi:hypothetical protein
LAVGVGGTSGTRDMFMKRIAEIQKERCAVSRTYIRC